MAHTGQIGPEIQISQILKKIDFILEEASIRLENTF